MGEDRQILLEFQKTTRIGDNEDRDRWRGMVEAECNWIT